MLKREIVSGLMMVLCLGPAVADDLADADKVVRDTFGAVTACLGQADLSADAKKEKVMAIVTPVFDFALMGKLALGRRHWPRLDAEQRERYTALFVEQLQNSYADKILLLSIDAVEYEPPVRVESKVHTGTVVSSQGERTPILYKLYKSGGAWKAYDVEISGVSIVSSYRAQYAQVLESGSVDDLLKKMAEKGGGGAEEKP